MTSVMSPTSTRGRESRSREKDFVSRLTDAGEEALQRLSELPGGQKAVTALNDLRARVDELGKKVRGIDALEARVATLEKQVAELKSKRATSASRSTPKRSSP